jgi:uncharacterized protein YlxP (DUF503 family)
MYVGALRMEFTLPGARSLKEKRKPLRSLKDRVRRRFNVAVAEVGGQDLWQRTVVGVALVAGTEQQLRRDLQAVRRYLEADPAFRVGMVQERVFERLDPHDSAPELPADRDPADDEAAPGDLLFTDL